MEFRFQGLVLEADTARTRALYAALGDVTAACACPGCRNYLRARDFLPRAVLDFFHALGIDPGKAAEVYPWCAERDGSALYYGGFYHFCGSLVQGEDCWRESGEMNTAGLITLAEGYRAGFTRRISLPEENLPAPVLQLEIDFHGVPWLLEEKNPY